MQIQAKFRFMCLFLRHMTEKDWKTMKRNSERWRAMGMRRWRGWRQCSPLFHFLKMSRSLPQTSPFKSHFWAPASLLRQPVAPSFPSSPSLLMPRPPVLRRRRHSSPFSKRLRWLTRVEFAFFENAAVGRIRRRKKRKAALSLPTCLASPKRSDHVSRRQRLSFRVCHGVPGAAPPSPTLCSTLILILSAQTPTFPSTGTPSTRHSSCLMPKQMTNHVRIWPFFYYF